MEDLRLWLPLGIAAAALLWNVRLHFFGVRKTELDALRAKIDGVATSANAATAAVGKELDDFKEAGNSHRAEIRERLGQVEQTLKAMPTSESVHQLALAVTEIRGDIRAQGETMKSVAATARRVEEFLLDAAKDKRA